MKIRNKLALTFTLLIAVLLLAISLFVYYFANLYTEKEFYMRLKQRAEITAQTFLKEDEVSSLIYTEIRDRHFKTLPEEREQIFRVDADGHTLSDIDHCEIPNSFFEEVFAQGYGEMEYNGSYYAGLFYHDNEGDFVVVISADDHYGRAKMNNLRNILLIAFCLSLGLTYVLGQYYARQFLHPISVITNKAEDIHATNLHLRLDAGNQKDELAHLALTFNKMLDRLETSFELQQNFVSNASHELRTPLTVILGETDVALRKDRTPEEYRNALATIEQEAMRLNLLITHLLKLAEAGYSLEGMSIEALRADELVMEVCEVIGVRYPEEQIALTGLPEDPEVLTVRGNASLLKVALTNVIDNACKFSGKQAVTITIGNEDGTVVVSVSDLGVGIPADEIGKISEPFYRAANVRQFEGSGVGLSLAQKIVKLHGGRMRITSDEGAGTDVRLELPDVEPEDPEGE